MTEGFLKPNVKTAFFKAILKVLVIVYGWMMKTEQCRGGRFKGGCIDCKSHPKSLIYSTHLTIFVLFLLEDEVKREWGAWHNRLPLH